jgi:hypothetical protein
MYTLNDLIYSFTIICIYVCLPYLALKLLLNMIIMNIVFIFFFCFCLLHAHACGNMFIHVLNM